LKQDYYDQAIHQAIQFRGWHRHWASMTWQRAAISRMIDLGALIKSRQTVLLLFTGLCAYVLTRGMPLDALETSWMAAGLFLLISGCTVLNMLLDRDIDARMKRTATRPVAAGRIRPGEALALGGALSLAGLGLSFRLDLRFGAVVALGFACDLLVYTAWLKRRTPLSILFGGVAGGMPVLAGRVLALGRVDLVGLLLGGSILLWIPSHILTLTIRHADDYQSAGVPTWPGVYGIRSTQTFIAMANLANTVVVEICALLLRVHPLMQAALLAASVGLCGLSIAQMTAPTERRNWLIFKLASLYMLLSSSLLTIGGLTRS
jgi:protoheme IX farnesyltransferase